MKLSFLRDLGIVSIAQALAGLSAFLYNMIISRRLGVADYGLFQAIMAIYSTLTVFVGPLNMATAHCLSTCSVPMRPFVVGKFVRFALWVGGGCSALVMLSALWLGGLLHSDMLVFIWLAALISATAVLTTFYGALQALRAYVLYAVAKVAESLVGLIAGSSLVVGGAGASGAVLGYVLGMTSVLLFLCARRSFFSLRSSALSVRSELRTIVSILIAYAVIFFVSDFPVVFARVQLDAEASGLYGAIYNLRNLVLPFCFAMAVPLYTRTVSVSSGSRTFLQVLVPVLALGGAFLGIGVCCPRLPFRVVYGSAFMAASEYLALYGLVLVLQMVAILTIFYQIARRTILLLDLLVPVVVLVVGMALPGLAIQRVIAVQIVAWASYLACSLPRWFVRSCLVRRMRTE